MKTVEVTTGYGLITHSNGLIERNRCDIGTMVIPDDSTYEAITEQEFNDLPIYSADTLISWALSQGFAADIMQHMAAFLDFANKATAASKNNFLAYATAVDLVDTANAIISKAIELGARL